MKTTNNDPNFSIVMAGGCNAKCDFCFNNDQPKLPTLEKDKYISNLMNTLHVLDDRFYQISITGGEPLLSPYFNEVFTLIPYFRTKYTNVLLTTNGTGLLDKIEKVSNAVDHINISRHHFDEAKNNAIFKGSYSMTDNELTDIIDAYGKKGIDISVNCVITDSTTREFIDSYIKWARNIGVEAVRFRKENGTLDKTPVELTFNDYKVMWEGSCPVCRTTQQRIYGVNVFWKSSYLEPSEVVPSDEIFELVFETDGNTYLDWNGQKLVNQVPIKKPEPKPEPTIIYRDRYISSNSCGSSRSSNSCGGSSSGCGRSSSSC
ncbi:MAG: radical SAM protein [Colwellia sp.]|nr:radical SAM protein [Colwellia sp.]